MEALSQWCLPHDTVCVPDVSCVSRCAVCVDLMKQKDEMHLTYAELREKYEVRHTSNPHTHKDHTND